MQQYQTYLFDWDGCLVDTLSVWMKAYQTTFKEFDLDPSPRDIANKAFGTKIGVKELGMQDPEVFYDALMHNISKDISEPPLAPFAKEVLHTLAQQGASIGIVSSSDTALITPSLQTHGLSKYIGAVVGAFDVAHLKPHPEPVFTALKQLNTDTTNAVIIGDSEKDILAGVAAGIESTLYYPPTHKYFYPEKKMKRLPSTYIIESLNQLINTLPSPT